MTRLPPSTSMLAVLLLALAAPAAAESWRLEHEASGDDTGLHMWSRSVQGSAYPEYRMELRLRAAPDEVVGALETNMFDSRTWPDNFQRKVLEQRQGFVLAYDYISVPLLADRDAVLRIESLRDPETGARRIEWSTTREAGPAPRSGVVRMPRSDGFWSVEPDGEGGSRAVYQAFVDFAGSLPGSLVSSSVESSILEQVGWLERTLRERLLARRR